MQKAKIETNCHYRYCPQCSSRWETGESYLNHFQLAHEKLTAGTSTAEIPRALIQQMAPGFD